MAKSKQKKNKQNKKKKPIIKFFAWTFAIAIFLGLSVFVWNYAISLNKVVEYSNVYTVEKQDLSNWISANGVVASENQTLITTQSTQKVKNIYVNTGDYVKKGDVLVEFDGSILQSELDQINESIKNLENYQKINSEYLEGILNDQTKLKSLQLEQMEQVIASTKKIYQSSLEKKKEYSTLVESEKQKQAEYEEVLSSETDTQKLSEYQQLYDNSLTTLEIYQNVLIEYTENTEYYKSQLEEYNESYELLKYSTDSEVTSAEDNYNASLFSDSTLETYRSDAKKLQSQIEELSIVASANGYITSVYVSEGSTCEDGKVALIEDQKSGIVTAYVKNSQIDQVYVGMKVFVSSDFSIDSEVEGIITEISKYSDDTTFPVTISLDNSKQILSGTSLSVRFITNSVEDKICVPFDTVMQDDSGNYVYKVIEGENQTYTLKKIPVTVLIEGSYYFAIESDDLSEGELVCGEAGIHTENQEIYINESTTF